jgi:hypothetical protein
VTIDRADLRCDAGRVSLAGAIDLQRGLMEALAQPGQRLDVAVDLARLVRLLPHTVALPPGTSVASGGLELHLESKPRPEGVGWEGRLHGADLEGTCNGKKLLWKNPIAIAFAAHQVGRGLPVFEHFRCESDFLQMEVAGSVEQLAVHARLDCDRLSDHVSQLLDLGGMRLQGRADVSLTAQRDTLGSFQLNGKGRLDQMLLVGVKGRRLREPSVTVQMDLKGAVQPSGVLQASQGSLHLQVGADGVDARLLQPVANLLSPQDASVQVALRGDLARWQGRLACLTDALDGMQLAGQAELTAQLRSTADALNFEELKVVARAFAFRGLGLTIDEPGLELTSAGQLVWMPTRIDARQTALACPTLSAVWPSLSLTLSPAGAPLIRGDAHVQGDVGRLQRWLLAPPPRTPDSLAGSFAGQVRLRPEVELQNAQLDLVLSSLAFGTPAAPLWREPSVHLLAEASLDRGKDLLQIGRLQVNSSVMGCEAAGQIAQLSKTMDLTLAGQLIYDLQKLEPPLRPYLGQTVQLAGRDSRPFRISGALSTAVPQPLAVAVAPASPDLLGRLAGELGLSWQSLQAYGADVGAAEAHGRLGGGLFSLAPVDAALNQGRLHLQPAVRLSPGPQEVSLAAGRIIDHARLTPAVCASALGYALPVLAGVAVVNGEISLDAQSATMPLADPTRVAAAGRFVIHSAQVGPGPLVRELTVLLRGPSTLTLAQENVVPFQVVNGRVYHRDLELHFPDLTIRTSGSVGLDGSLALVAEMPVPPKWLPASELGQALGRQTIRLPIGGTLSHPQLDQRALREASERFVREAARDTARGVIRKGMGNELNRLFHKR